MDKLLPAVTGLFLLVGGAANAIYLFYTYGLAATPLVLLLSFTYWWLTSLCWQSLEEDQ